MIISAVHSLVTFLLLIELLELFPAFFDETTVLTIFDKAAIIIPGIPVFPLKAVLHFHSANNTLAGPGGYVPMGLNSLFWGFMIYFLVRYFLHHRRKPADGQLPVQGA